MSMGEVPFDNKLILKSMFFLVGYSIAIFDIT
jgi:hypothetical protein